MVKLRSNFRNYNVFNVIFNNKELPFVSFFNITNDTNVNFMLQTLFNNVISEINYRF